MVGEGGLGSFEFVIEEQEGLLSRERSRASASITVRVILLRGGGLGGGDEGFVVVDDGVRAREEGGDAQVGDGLEGGDDDLILEESVWGWLPPRVAPEIAPEGDATGAGGF